MEALFPNELLVKSWLFWSIIMIKTPEIHLGLLFLLLCSSCIQKSLNVAQKDIIEYIFVALHLWILWMSFTVCLMYWMYSAMLWRKSHVSQLLREGQAFMMKWHFADIKIGQFVLDVVECSCWDAVSYQDEKVHVFSSDWPRFKTAGEGLLLCDCQLHSLNLHFAFQKRLLS